MGTSKAFPFPLFGIAFGLSGLAGTWTVASESLGITAGVANALWILAAVAWVISLVRYGLGARTARQVRSDVNHPVLGVFVALIPASGLLLGAHLSQYSAIAGKTVVVIMIVITAALATFFVRRLMLGGLELDQLHPAYLLPTVAITFIGGQALATVGLRELGFASFGIGLLLWLLIGAGVTVRLATRPALPDALIATFAIYAAPPAVAGNAYFALNGHPDVFQHTWLGTFILFLLVQVALIPTIAKLPFALTFWTMTFTTAAAGTYGIHWLTATQAPLLDLWTIAILAVVTLWIGWVAVRSILLVAANHRSQAEPTPVHR
ncbi:C4-dicarboxylate transporter [Streptomyces sp. SID13031]|uniref:SLAC1 family transporter n=1 Tax=Streptomyces sp. SID13031 TaxID=2706046 RepID=UPI0013C5D5F8|nr:C4-dicarboxylate transporter [Streptomyces sp. SID13031]NEA35457.1 C4-dicarboxylate transporter [Streptomyces sp. SID13031]